MSLITYYLPLVPCPLLSLIPYPYFLIPYPLSLSPSPLSEFHIPLILSSYYQLCPKPFKKILVDGGVLLFDNELSVVLWSEALA